MRTMALFKDMLKADETLFKNEVALDFSYIPKLIPYRETQQKYIAECIKPLFQDRNGKNIVVHGPPGIGKTVAIKHIFQELEEETDEVIPLYINCWQKNTTYKVILEMCELLDYKFTQNKKTEELFAIIKNKLNQKKIVFCFDEIDKTEDLDFLYMLLEEIYKKTIILITNYKSAVEDMDERIKSRLVAELIYFKPYNEQETLGIIKNRVNYAFHPGVIDQEVLENIAKKTFAESDIRTGLHLLKEAAMIAENKASKKITKEDADEAIKKLDTQTLKKSADLTKDERDILEIIKNNSGKKMGDLFSLYEKSGGEASYKTFHRKMKKLKEAKYVSLSKTEGGSEGNTTLVSYIKTKKLTEF